MYKTYTAADYRKFLKLDDSYHVDGFISYGAGPNQTYPLEQLENSLKELGIDYSISKLKSDVLYSISEIRVGEKTFWFTNAYGGAELSELLHLACLLGSKKNIHLGCCGGLTAKGSIYDLIIPSWSYGLESSATMYQPSTDHHYYPDEELCDKFKKQLSNNYNVLSGPIITCQATLAETWENIQGWSRQGYYGVEMETATVFAVSNYFKVPTAAILYISDNLIKNETLLNVDSEHSQKNKRQISQDLFNVAVSELL